MLDRQMLRPLVTALLVCAAVHTDALAPEFWKSNLTRLTTTWKLEKPRRAAWVYTAALREGATWYPRRGLIGSITSVIESGSVYDVVVILDVVDGSRLDPLFKQALLALGVARVGVLPHDVPNHLLRALQSIKQANQEAKWKYTGCFNKLLGWALTEYDKVALMDFDVTAWSNPDHAMLFPGVSAVLDKGMATAKLSAQGEWAVPFQAGIVVLEPSEAELWGMVELLRVHLDEGRSLGDLPEQHILNEYWNLRWFQLPVGFNLLPYDIPGAVSQEEPDVPEGMVVTLHHVGVFKADKVGGFKEHFTRGRAACEHDGLNMCRTCCRRAARAVKIGEARIEAALGAQQYKQHLLAHVPHQGVVNE